MGQDESKTKAAEPARAPADEPKPAAPTASTAPRPEAESYGGIPAASSLVRRQQSGEQFPLDISIPPANIVQLDKATKGYFHQMAATVNKNQEQLSGAVKQQLEDYIKMSTLLDTRRNELDGRLAKMLSLFRAFDSEVKTSVELLNAEIERAERIAADIGELPKYSEFQKQ
jgi:hypothetical protein